MMDLIKNKLIYILLCAPISSLLDKKVTYMLHIMLNIVLVDSIQVYCILNKHHGSNVVKESQ